MTRREFRSLSSPESVREAIASLELGGATERVSLPEAGGRVLAQRVDAPIDVPGFDRAAMDGYAVQARDTFDADGSAVGLDVVGTVHAGSEPGLGVDAGTAAEIATGAVMPRGADAVVPVEETADVDDGVAIKSSVTPGDHVMPRGADLAAGDRTLGPGTRIGPRHLGLLAALGTETVTVRRHPRVGVVSTGDELVQPGEPLDSSAGQIYDVNSHSLSGAVRAAGGEATVYRAAADDLDALRERLEAVAGECDLLCTSGSTSAGQRDLLYELVESEGEKLVHGVALKPGRPLLVGHIFGTPYVGLPGYPVSALTVFRTFVAPALREASGRPEPTEATVEATLRTRIRYDGGRLRLLAVGLVERDDRPPVAYATAKGSGATTTLGEADGVVRMPPERSLFSPGTTVDVMRFDAGEAVPNLLGVGEPDPTLSDLFDRFPRARYLRLGRHDARRWYDDGVPDLLVTAGIDSGDPDADTPDDGSVLGRWRREWGLVVPDGNPAGIDGIQSLIESDCSFANLDASLAVRGAFDDRLAGATVDQPTTHIDGYNRALPGIESAARAVAAGRADVGLALGETADELGLGFVSLGDQPVTVLGHPDRTEKAVVAEFSAAVSTVADDAP